jgi:hypothetical protein
MNSGTFQASDTRGATASRRPLEEIGKISLSPFYL